MKTSVFMIFILFSSVVLSGTMPVQKKHSLAHEEARNLSEVWKWILVHFGSRETNPRVLSLMGPKITLCQSDAKCQLVAKEDPSVKSAIQEIGKLMLKTPNSVFVTLPDVSKKEPSSPYTNGPFTLTLVGGSWRITKVDLSTVAQR